MLPLKSLKTSKSMIGRRRFCRRRNDEWQVAKTLLAASFKAHLPTTNCKYLLNALIGLYHTYYMHAFDYVWINIYTHLHSEIHAQHKKKLHSQTRRTMNSKCFDVTCNISWDMNAKRKFDWVFCCCCSFSASVPVIIYL